MSATIPLRALTLASLSYALGNARAGVHETGGNNCGPEIEVWQHLGGGVRGESWCQFFVYAMQVKAWCAAKGLLTGKTDAANQAIMMQNANAMSAETHIARTGSCQDSADAAKLQGRFHDRDFVPSPGDQIYYVWRGTETHHTGIVQRPGVAVEGNTSVGSDGSQDNGQGVYADKQRPRSVIYGYAHFE